MKNAVDFGGMVDSVMGAPPAPPAARQAPPAPATPMGDGPIRVSAADLRVEMESRLQKARAQAGQTSVQPVPADGKNDGLDDAVAKVLDEGTPPAPVVDGSDSTPPPAPTDADGSPPDDVYSPPAPVEPKPAEPTDSDLLADAPGQVLKDPKGRETWKTLKRKAKKVDELEAKVAELEASKNATPAEDVTALKARLAEIEAEKNNLADQVGQLDVTRSAAFKERFDKPANGLYQKSYTALIQNGMSAQQAKSALDRLRRSPVTADSVSEMLAGVPAPVQGVVFNSLQELETIVQARAAAVADWKNTRAALSEEESRKSLATTLLAIESATDAAIEELKVEGSWMFRPSGNNAEWNKAVEARVAAAKGVLKNGTPGQLAKYVAEGVAAAHYRKFIDVQHKRIAALEGQLKARGMVVPRLGGSERPPRPPAPAVDPTKPVQVDDWLAKNM